MFWHAWRHTPLVPPLAWQRRPETSVSWRPAWFPYCVPGQSELHSETLCQKEKKKDNVQLRAWKSTLCFFMALSHHILTFRKGIKSHVVVVATPLIPASGKQSQVDLGISCQPSLQSKNRIRLRIAGAAQRNPMLDASEGKRLKTYCLG